MLRESLIVGSVVCALTALLSVSAYASADLALTGVVAPGGPGGPGGLVDEIPEPRPCASVTLSQNPWDGPDPAGLGCGFFPPGGTRAIGLARAFTMPLDGAFAVHCVHGIIATNTSEFTTTANIWLGTPGTPMGELVLLASRTIDIPIIYFDAGGSVSFDFTDGIELPLIPAGATAFVEIFVPTRNIGEGGPDGQSSIYVHAAEASAPTYVRSPSCMIPDFVDLDSVLPGARHLVLRVDGEWVDAVACPADLDGDGTVDGADLGLLLSAWGPCAGCGADLTGDGTVDGADLGLLLSAWGACS